MSEGNGNGFTSHDGPARHTAQDFARDANAQLEHARLVFDDVNRKVVAFVRERPGTALLGALALGWVVGKLASRGK